MKAKKKNSKKPVVRNRKVAVVTKSKHGRQTEEHERNYHAAMDGNAFWKQRSKHGRDKLFSTPALMLESAMEYFSWCDNNPDNRAELVKYEGSAEQVKVDLKRPYTMQGLCRYLNCNTEYFRDFNRALRAKNPEMLTQEDKDFAGVIKCIHDIVEEQQVSGALTGHFNANIISRLLGLVDKKDITSDSAPIAAPKIEVYNVGPPLAGSEDQVTG